MKQDGRGGAPEPISGCAVPQPHDYEQWTLNENMDIEKVETTYHAQLKASDYDTLEVVQDMDKRITVKFLDTRWRTIPETIALFQEIIAALKTL